MQEHSTSYVRNLPTGKDRLVVKFVTLGHMVKKFSVQYETLLRGYWVKVVRYDSKHEVPHRHTFSANGDPYRAVMGTVNLNEALTQAIQDLTLNFQKYCDNYHIKLERN